MFLMEPLLCLILLVTVATGWTSTDLATAGTAAVATTAGAGSAGCGFPPTATRDCTGSCGYQSAALCCGAAVFGATVDPDLPAGDHPQRRGAEHSGEWCLLSTG